MPKVLSDRERTDFGRRLKDARLAAGMTQAYVCKRLGFSQGTLAELESTSLSSALTPQLANLYGVSALWLASGEGERLAAEPNDADEAALLQAFRSLKQGSRERVQAVAFLRGMAAVAAPAGPPGKQQAAGAP